MMSKSLSVVASALLLSLFWLVTACGGAEAEEVTDITKLDIPQDTPVVRALEAGVSQRITEEGVGYFVLKGCNKCHKTKGKIKTIGPILAGIRDRMDIPTMEAWIRHPGRLKRGTLMPPWDGSDKELISLMAYLRTL